MDGQTRGEELGDVAKTTAQVRRLAMGVPRDRGSQYQVESLESAKKVGHPLWLDNHVSRGASNRQGTLRAFCIHRVGASGPE